MVASGKNQPKRRRWWIRLIVVGVLVGGIVGAALLRPRRVIVVRAAQVKIDVVRDMITSVEAGDIKPQRQAIIRAQVSSPVRQILTRVGDRVREGALLVQLDERDQKAQLVQAGTGVGSAAAQRNQTMARILTLSQEATRNRALLQQGAAPKQAAETADRAVVEASTSVGVIDAQIKQGVASRRIAALMLDKTRIRAPFAGLITSLPVNEGDVLPLGTPIIEVMDDQHPYLQVAVDEADAGKVRLGQEAVIRLDALPKGRIQGKVARIDPVIKRDIKGARTLLLDIEIVNLPDALAQGLLVGMSANVEITVAQKDQVWTIPTPAILGRGVKTEVYWLKPAGKDQYTLRRLPVRVGVSNWERSEILPGEGTGADVVLGSWVVSSLNDKELAEGALVRIHPESTK